MWYNNDDYYKPVRPHRKGGWARRMEMLDVVDLDKWLSGRKDECFRCGAKHVAFGAFESMFAECDACGHKLNVSINTIRTIALSDEAMKTLKVLALDKRLPMAFRAWCDMVLSLSHLWREFFGMTPARETAPSNSET
jgi:hypothetical protein